MIIHYLKLFIRKCLRRYNQQLVYAPYAQVSGTDLTEDLKLIIPDQNPVLLDVGANAGQTIAQFLNIFPGSQIYAFEPSSEMFRLLNSKEFGNQVSLQNYGLGKEIARREFNNYKNSHLSSFLILDPHEENCFRQIEIENKEWVELRTVDFFLQQNNIPVVNLLKIDAQGFDLGVLRGAEESLKNGVIQNILVELNFIRKYVDQGQAKDTLEFLSQHHMYLVDFYQKIRQKSILVSCDALFCKR